MNDKGRSVGRNHLRLRVPGNVAMILCQKHGGPNSDLSGPIMGGWLGWAGVGGGPWWGSVGAGGGRSGAGARRWGRGNKGRGRTGLGVRTGAQPPEIAGGARPHQPRATLCVDSLSLCIDSLSMF